MPTLAEFIAGTLADAGLRTVFGLPGGEVLPLLEALRQAGIEFVLVRHEASAVYMAEVTARLTRRPSACLVTLGPGAANAVPGAAHAHLDRAPVLLLSADTPAEAPEVLSHQRLDLAALMAPVSKASWRLTPEAAPAMLRRALALAQGGRPGPVHLSLSHPDSLKALPEPGPQPVIDQTHGQRLDSAALAEARRILEGARRPVIVVGLGVEPEGPYAALRRVAEAWGAPVITTPKAKGSLPEDHPLAVGVIGLTLSDPAYEVLAEADAILAVGFDVVELVRAWEHPVPLIWAAPWPNEDPALSAAVELVGLLEPVLEQLAGPAGVQDPAWGAPRVAAFRADAPADDRAGERAGRLAPQAVLRALRAAAPRGAILATDVGAHKILAALEWPTYEPHTYLVANGLSPMGYGLPAAIAASRLRPETPVICLTGDGGLAMAMGELGLLAELAAPVAVVVLRDDALDLIRAKQLRAGLPVYGTELVNPDFVDLAAAYGLAAQRATDAASCRVALQGVWRRGRPGLIEVPIDPSTYPTAASS